jgi:hypothetical protein
VVCCRYEYYEELAGGSRRLIKSTKSSSHTFGPKELQPGNTTLHVKAIDSEGAEVVASMQVWVGPVAADFNMVQDIFQTDIQQAAGSNDASLLANTGNQISKTVQTASKAGKSGGKGRRLLQESGGAGGDQTTGSDLEEVVKSKVVQLLAAYVSSAAGSVADAATVRQVSWEEAPELSCQAAALQSSSCSGVYRSGCTQLDGHAAAPEAADNPTQQAHLLHPCS